MIEKSPLFLNLECWKCKSKFHFLNQCPQINSWRDRLTVNKNNISSHRFQYSVGITSDHQRRYYVRSKVQSQCNKNIAKFIKIRESLEKVEYVEHLRYFFPDYNISV